LPQEALTLISGLRPPPGPMPPPPLGSVSPQLPGALFHALKVFHTLLSCSVICSAHFGTILAALLLRHQLAAVYLILILD
jgi:hypothetical protein